jgi:hypothetical protein
MTNDGGGPGGWHAVINNSISVGSGDQDFDLDDAGVVIDPSSGYNL